MATTTFLCLASLPDLGNWLLDHPYWCATLIGVAIVVYVSCGLVTLGAVREARARGYDWGYESEGWRTNANQIIALWWLMVLFNLVCWGFIKFLDSMGWLGSAMNWCGECLVSLGEDIARILLPRKN
jgi:hypothetical protein